MNGIINIYKEKGYTSHDVVNVLRKLFHTKKIGHTGTLDPDATGVLPICIGDATRIAEYLTKKNKTYIARMAFGNATDTQDASGEVIEISSLPSISENEFKLICEEFLGKQFQVPPMYSAIKYKGKPLYKYAREGIVITDLPTREIEIYNVKVLYFSSSEAEIEISCSKGTYIRTLCVDIAKRIGVCAHLTHLERTQSGIFKLESSILLNTLKASDNLDRYLISIEESLVDMDSIDVSLEDFQKIQNGQSVKVAISQDIIPIVAKFQNKIISIGKIEKNFFKPRKVFSGK